MHDDYTYGCLPRANDREIVTRDAIRTNPATWPPVQGQYTRLIRPIVTKRVASGWNSATCPQAHTIWYDDSDHTKSFGKSASGQYVWDVNLFAVLNFFTASVFDGVGTYSEVLTLNLLDSSAAIIKTATGSASYQVTAGGAWNNITLTAISWTFDTAAIAEFHALQCINTGSGPHGPGYLTGQAGVRFITDYICRIGAQP